MLELAQRVVKEPGYDLTGLKILRDETISGVLTSEERFFGIKKALEDDIHFDEIMKTYIYNRNDFDHSCRLRGLTFTTPDGRTVSTQGRDRGR